MIPYRMSSDVGGRFDINYVSRWGCCGGGRVWILFEEMLETERVWEGGVWYGLFCVFLHMKLSAWSCD